jgi:hypothetical protein
MSLYIIEDRYGALLDSSVNYNYAKSLQHRNYPDGHVVEMVPAKPKVKVSQEEAEMLEKAKHNPTLRPSFLITEYSNSHKGYILGNDLEDRLMCAYVIGWTVGEKPKRYVLPMPGTEYRSKLMHGNAQYYAIKGTGNWRPDAIALGTDDAVKHGYTVTKSEIDTAPDWVKGITPIEVTE